MPRIPYLPSDVQEPADLVSAVRARRGGALLNLDRMLLHSPPLTRGWNGFLGAVRSELTVPAKLRELATCAVAVLNGADYELHHHEAPFLATGGTEAQLAVLRSGPGADGGADAFDAEERAVLQLALELTREVRVADGTFEAVRAFLGERGTVELVGVIAAYNMVCRFLVALGIESE
ncbi:MAG TPA: carboxymuconolactone decarboxylase family protein [Anaeromyxobacter sp.]